MSSRRCSSGRTAWKESIHAEGITLTTFHVGSPESLVVMNDWCEFFHSDINVRIRFVTCSETPGSFDPSILEARFPNIEVVDIPRQGLAITQLEPIAVWAGITGASTSLVALVKLDTLPYRTADRQQWLYEVAAAVDRHLAWGMTAFRSHECRRVDESFALTPAFSHNLSIVQKDSWQHAIESEDPDVLERVESGTTTPDDRFRFERAVENHLRSTRQRNVRPAQTEDWSAFHINQWERDLLAIRERYRRRSGIKGFLQPSDPTPTPVWNMSPHKRYYGQRPPSMSKRVRVATGRWRRRVLGR